MASVEQVIAVKIKAIVEGLGDVRALSQSVRALRGSSSSSGLGRLSRDVSALGSGARITRNDIGGLATGLGRLTKAAQQNGLGVFYQDLRTASRALKDFQALQRLDPFHNNPNTSLSQTARILKSQPLSRNEPSSALSLGLRKLDPFQSASNLSLSKAAKELKAFGVEAERTAPRLKNFDVSVGSVTQRLFGLRLSASGASAVFLSMGIAIGTAIAAVAALGAGLAAFGFGKLVAEGIRFNAVIESARIGIATLVANTYDVKDAAGNLLSPVNAFNTALGTSSVLERALQKSAIETKFEFEDILGFFNSTVVASAGLKTNLNELVTLTQGFALAAGATNVPIEQVNTGIKQMLTGYVTVRNRLAQVVFPGLGTPEINKMLKTYREQGNLVEFLTEKMLVFRLSADQVAQSFDAVASNVADAFKVFAADATLTLFESLKRTLGFIITQIVDLSGDTVKLTPTFEKIAAILNDILGYVGAQLIAAVKEIFATLGGWATYLYDNRDAVLDLVANTYVLAGEVGGILIDLTSILGALGLANVKAGSWVDTTAKLSLFVGYIRDLLSLLIGLIETAVGGVNLIPSPLKMIGDSLNGIADSLDNLIGKATSFGAALRSAASYFNILGNAQDEFGASVFSSGMDNISSGLNNKGLFGALDRLNSTKNLIGDFKRGQNLGGAFTYTPKNYGGGGGRGAGRGGANDARRLAKERESVTRKLIDAESDFTISNLEDEVKLFKEANEAIFRSYKRRYDLGLISAREFYAKKQELDVADLDKERSLLEQKAQELRSKAILDVKNVLPTGNFEELEKQVLAGGALDAAKTPVAVMKAYAIIFKSLEDQNKLAADIVSNENARAKAVGETTNSITDQKKATQALRSSIDAEFAGSVGNEGVKDQFDLFQRFREELPKILLETNEGTQGVAELAAALKEVTENGATTVTSLSGLLSVIRAFKGDVSSLSEEFQAFLKLAKRLDFISRQKQTFAEADRIRAGFDQDIDEIDANVASGRTSSGDARAQIFLKQAAALAQLKQKLAELRANIKQTREDGGVVTEQDVQAVRRYELSIRDLTDSTRVLRNIYDQEGQDENTFSAAQDRIEALRQAGAVSSKLAREQLNEARTLRINQINTEIADLEALGSTAGATLNKIATLRTEAQGLQNDINAQQIDLAQNINGRIEDSLSTFVDTVVDGSQAIGDAFRSLLSSMLTGIAKAIAQALLLKYVLEPLGLTGNDSGGLGGLLSGASSSSGSLPPPAPGHADGGIISGAGTGVSDSIPAMLSHGEGIIPARRVAQYGRGLVQSIINGSFVPRLSVRGFAMGGIVGDAAGAGAKSGGTRIINSVDPNLVKDFMTSSQGEEIIINIIGRNPGLVQRLV